MPDDTTPETRPALIAPELVEINQQGRARLRAGRCRRCGALSFPRACICADCLSEDVEAVGLSGRGRLYSFSVIHQGPNGWIVPYTLGYVDLPEGIRVLAHIDVVRAKLAIDMELEIGVGTVAVAPDGSPLGSYVFGEVAG